MCRLHCGCSIPSNPETKSRLGSGLTVVYAGEPSLAASEAGNIQKLKQINQSAVAHVPIAWMMIKSKQTRNQITTWLGSDAFTNSNGRKKVLRILNSNDTMHSNVVFVYPETDAPRTEGASMSSTSAG